MPPYIDRFMRIPMYVSGLLISLCAQLILFSCATNMSRQQERGYMQTTYKKRKHVNIPFDTTARSNPLVRLVHWWLTTYIS